MLFGVLEDADQTAKSDTGDELAAWADPVGTQPGVSVTKRPWDRYLLATSDSPQCSGSA